MTFTSTAGHLPCHLIRKYFVVFEVVKQQATPQEVPTTITYTCTYFTISTPPRHDHVYHNVVTFKVTKYPFYIFLTFFFLLKVNKTEKYVSHRSVTAGNVRGVGGLGVGVFETVEKSSGIGYHDVLENHSQDPQSIPIRQLRREC